MEKDSKQEQILDAALTCLARYGIVKATMDDIAGILGMKKASLYYYYKNKEAIFMDVIEREFQRVKETVESKISDGANVSEKITLLFTELGRYFIERAEVFEMNVQAMLDNHDIMRRVQENIREKNNDFLASMIKEGVDNGEFRKIDAERLADIVHTIFEALRYNDFRNSNSPRITKEIMLKNMENNLFILDILLNGLKKA